MISQQKIPLKRKAILVYGNAKIALRFRNSLPLSHQKNSFYCDLGKSGGGKISMLNCIGTIDKPTKGDIYICGKSNHYWLTHGSKSVPTFGKIKNVSCLGGVTGFANIKILDFFWTRLSTEKFIFWHFFTKIRQSVFKAIMEKKWVFYHFLRFCFGLFWAEKTKFHWFFCFFSYFLLLFRVLRMKCWIANSIKKIRKKYSIFIPKKSEKSKNFEKSLIFKKIEVSLAKMQKTQFDFQL